MLKPFKQITNKYFLFKKHCHFRARTPLCHAPYNLTIYRQLLEQVCLSPDMEFVPFASKQKKGFEKIKMFIRHDVDTKQCVENLPLFLEIDKSLNVWVGVYFRVDDEEYSLMQYRDIVQSYNKLGFEIGLHTVCYKKDNYLDEFKRETDKFTYEVGFRPRSFSVHGLGDYRLNIRMQFYEEIASRMWEFGYKFGDIPQVHAYDYVIHDCHLDENGNRFIYDEVINLPSFFRKGENYLILTHPCYWAE